MAIMWNGSLSPWIDPNGAPYSGAKAYFFDAGTTTPRTVYLDSSLSESRDHSVVANASGMFPPVFLPPGDFRLRIATATGVTIWDIDGISTPSTGEIGGGGGGDTPIELLARTGDYKFRHGTGTQTGWVRANGRSIGNSTSGATERANSDCEALFSFLWVQDSTLVITGGRGANAASDWAVSKNIALPDLRLRGLIGMAAMGAGTSTLITASAFDGSENGNNLGATVGAGTVTLSVAQMPDHAHSLTINPNGAHNHTVDDNFVGGAGPGEVSSGPSYARTTSNRTASTSGSHAHAGAIGANGGGEAHPNVQPSAVATCYLKL